MPIEPPDVAVEQSLSHPWLRRKRAKASLSRRLHRFVRGVEESLENAPLLARLTGDRRKVVDHARIELRQEPSNSIAHEARVDIRSIDAGSDAAFVEEGFDLRTRDFEQRTNHAIATQRMDAAKAGKAS